MSNNTERTVLNDRYEIQQRIGRGGMADVFLARDLLLDRPVAIKVLFPEFATDPNFVERFRREAQAAANLNHPNIVGVYDWGKYANTYFMAMEYVQGRTLADILRANGHINSIQAAEIASEVSAALGFAHRNSVVHRDIKPANILIGSNGQVKVADFGIARAMNAPTESNLTQVGAVMGTATYFSPEQAQGAQPDPRSDLYSLGIVLYEMVAGRPPFSGDNPVSIAYKQVHDSPQPLNQIVADVPRPFEAIVAKLLAKQPDVRYPNAEALREDLRRFRNNEPVQALAGTRPPTPPAAHATATLPRTAAVPAGATTAMPRTAAVPVGATAAMPRTQAMQQQQGQPPQQYGSNRTGWYAVAGFLALIALVIGGVLLFKQLSKDDEQPTTFAMPELTNALVDDAVKQLDDLGLVAVLNEEPEAAVADGTVSHTDPIAGVIVTKGDTVQVFYRPSLVPFAIEDVSGKTVDEATPILTAQGLVINPTIVTENDPTVESGKVIRTDPPAGTQAKQGDPITLVVSGGPDQVAVPAVAGLSQANAQATLESEEFGFVVTIEEEASDSVDAGTAIRTDPAQSQLLAKGSAIKLIVSSGPELKKVPAMVGTLEAQARNSLSSAGLPAPEVSFQPVAIGSPDDGRVISQSVDAGQEVAPDTVIKLKIGKAVVPVTTTSSTTTTSTTTTTTTTTTVPTT